MNFDRAAAFTYAILMKSCAVLSKLFQLGLRQRGRRRDSIIAHSWSGGGLDYRHCIMYMPFRVATTWCSTIV